MKIIKMYLSELKNITTEIKKKNAMEGILNRSHNIEKWVSNQEERIVEITQLEVQKGKNN